MTPILPPLPSLRCLARRLAAACAATATREPAGAIGPRTLFVLLYAGAVGCGGRWCRPSQVSDEQALRPSDAERVRWADASARPGHAPAGRRWYAENTRESVRAVLHELLVMGAVVLRPELPAQSAAPRWALDPAFAGYLTAPPPLAGAALAAWLATRGHPAQRDAATERLAAALQQAIGAADAFLAIRSDHPASAPVRAATGAARDAVRALAGPRP